ncbi:hypothetical protein BCR33DRAFT_262832 [Rhizoclosmatium globosum]|uniref:Uncharacterized protein n=1 Tax=Rhizoclosmatium globosum TaxID=329046 RepID=A0A1Y2C901_9FUNG|nr:hypothetical protein BCR33DRAFT_262832 [Rhizoclosmatium globosum]|eukprot:ORY43513.1 hypothetical protein BCR33DRAFT_262832 [Rhizoclosmatium globosum]
MQPTLSFEDIISLYITGVTACLSSARLYHMSVFVLYPQWTQKPTSTQLGTLGGFWEKLFNLFLILGYAAMTTLAMSLFVLIFMNDEYNPFESPVLSFIASSLCFYLYYCWNRFSRLILAISRMKEFDQKTLADFNFTF